MMDQSTPRVDRSEGAYRVAPSAFDERQRTEIECMIERRLKDVRDPWNSSRGLCVGLFIGVFITSCLFHFFFASRPPMEPVSIPVLPAPPQVTLRICPSVHYNSCCPFLALPCRSCLLTYDAGVF